MVDILVDGITSLELIVSITIIISKVLGYARIGHDDLAVLIGSHRECLTLSQLLINPCLIVPIILLTTGSSLLLKLQLLGIVVGEVVVSILEHALALESVDRAKRVAHDDTAEDRVGAKLTIAGLRVQVVKYALIHRQQLVDVLGHIEIGSNRELADSDELITRNR